MEAILERSAAPYEQQYPVSCCAEKLDQLVSAGRQPLPPAPGRPQRDDDEYCREGTCKRFMGFQPLTGWRPVEVTARRTAHDVAPCMNALVDDDLPKARRISVVVDNLKTQTPAAFYEAYPPAQARRILRTLDVRFTPTQGSGLNMAAIALAVLGKQGLAQRLPTQQAVSKTIASWETRRNAAHATANWQFTTTKARRKWRRLYPA
jgi:DDE superfamily endonuclease